MPQTRDGISQQQGISGVRAGRIGCVGAMCVVLLWMGVAIAQPVAGNWRAATDKELKSLLPARATVGKEHIETEMRTASGITDGRGNFIAGIVLITAGYSADGKYSHYFIVQAPMQIGQISLPPGEYVFGWQREGDALHVHFYDANTGVERGSVFAKRMEGNVGVVSLKIWTPQTRSVIQLGRFGIPYQLEK
ncbi:MAG TPA: hypothetical protein VFC39_15115 [Acidobacteriaceae bacterium]|nr:hypothetical protein [Acidobacteriaceae bacterium]